MKLWLSLLITMCLLFSAVGTAHGEKSNLFRGKVKIIDFEIPDEPIILGKNFDVTVKLKNDGIFFPRVFVRVDLVDDFTGLVRKEIGNSSMYERLLPRGERDFTIQCNIPENNVEYYKSYSIIASVFVKKCAYLFISDFTTPYGIKLENFSIKKLLENTKVRITNFKVNDIVDKKFDVNITVTNFGDSPVNIFLRVDMVKPSSLGISGLEGFGTLSEEIGHSSTLIKIEANKTESFKIRCGLSTANMKSHFYVQGILFAFLKGQRIQIDSSTMHSVQLPCGYRIWLGFANSIGSVLSLIATVVLTVALSAFVVRVIWRKELNIFKLLKEGKIKKQ